MGALNLNSKPKTRYCRQQYSRLCYHIKRQTSCFPIVVLILLFHLIDTPWCHRFLVRLAGGIAPYRFLFCFVYTYMCMCVHICVGIYIYMCTYICIWLTYEFQSMFWKHQMFAIYFLSTPAVHLTWPIRVQRLICRSDEGLVMVWSRGLSGSECRSLKAEYVIVLAAH